MNFYRILEINKNANKKEIRDSYKRLALKYHPDKNKSKEASDKFRDIQIAYETLYDDKKRINYDLLSDSQKIELYNVFNEYFVSVSPEYKFMYNKVISSLYNRYCLGALFFNSANFSKSTLLKTLTCFSTSGL